MARCVHSARASSGACVTSTTVWPPSRVSRAMWNRRAQEYEAKINSGDPVSIAEVVRDLHRNAGQPDQSYSERQIYEAADFGPEFAAGKRGREERLRAATAGRK